MAGFTRSQTFKQELEARHPEAEEAFKQGVGSVLRQWTALELAVSHGWGGTNSQHKADELLEDVLAMFGGKERIYKDDVQLLLEEVMDEDFQTVCEDGSPAELGELICTMWRACGAGDFALVHNALNSEKARAEVLARSHGLDSTTGDALDSDDDDDDDGGMDVEGDEMMAVEEEEAVAAETEEVTAPPLVDADGFMTAGKKKKKSKQKS